VKSTGIGGSTLGLLAMVVVLTWTTARADRLHLVEGGVIETDSWWLEDGLLIYRSAAGTVGLPQELVARIEAHERSGEPAPLLPRPPPPPPPTQPVPAPRRVKPATAERLAAANAALMQGDPADAVARYRAVMDETGAEFVEPRVGYALSQLALGEDEMAYAVVLEALAREPRHPVLLEILGDLHDRKEKVAEALVAFREAFAAAPGDRLREKILKAERELAAGQDFELNLSSHFNVRFDGVIDEQLGQAVTDFLEEQYWAMTDLFDDSPRQPITVLLYPLRDFHEVTQAPEWVEGLYDGKIRLPLGGLDRLDPRAQRLLRHELAHAFVQAKSRGRSPRWLHEGLAQHLDGSTLSRADRQAVFRDLREGDPASWEQRSFSYPLAHSLTSYLLERRGLDVLIDLLEELGEGTDLDSALSGAYGANYATLCRDWGTEVLAQGGR